MISYLSSEYSHKHMKMYKNFAQFTKDKRKEANLTNRIFEKAGVALTAVRKIVQGKDN